jgi:hypothetical protein
MTRIVNAEFPAGCAARAAQRLRLWILRGGRKARPAQVRFLLVRSSVQDIIVTAVTGDRAERLQYHVLPTDDPLRALNILREAAGLQPLSDKDEEQDEEQDG